MRVGRERREAVRRRHEEAAADDEVAVAVAVRGRAEVGRVGSHGQVVDGLGVDEVGIGVVAAEVGQGRAVHHRAGAGAERAFQDRLGIGSGDGRHGVEPHGEAAREHGPDAREVEQSLHEGLVVGHRIDDLDRHVAELHLADAVEVDIGGVECSECGDGLGLAENRLGGLLRGRAAVRCVVLDAEVAIWAARVVAGRQNDAAEGAAFADEVRGRGRRQDAAAAHDDPAEAVGGRHLHGGLDRLAVEVAAIAADHQRLAPEAVEAVEDRLDEILDVTRLLEVRHLLAQSGGAGLLVVEGRRRDRLHGSVPAG